MNGTSNGIREPAEWVEIVEPTSQQLMYANLDTGKCTWDPPEGAKLKRSHSRQWWELFDMRTARYYYYNTTTKETKWERPNVDDKDIIPLTKLQIMHQKEQETQTYSGEAGLEMSMEMGPAAVYAQDISPEAGIISLRSSSPDQLSQSIKSGCLGQGVEHISIAESSSGGFFSARRRFPPPTDEISPCASMERRSRHQSEEETEGWSRDAPKNPLADPASKTLRKEAPALFKRIQSYMGDRKSKNNIDQLALSVCEAAAARQESADEACLLLMRQLTRNARADSLRRGWELLAILLALSVPSRKTTALLSNFCERHSEKLLDPPEVAVSHFAAQCIRRLNKVTSSRPRPSLAAVHEARVHIFHPPQFGAKLEELMDMQAERFYNLRIPWIEHTLIELVLSEGGPRTEGIFRVAANPEQISTAKARLDQWLKPQVSDAHVPACLLKSWLRELPDPLLPSSLYQRALDAGDNPSECAHIASLLTPPASLVLARLIHLLQTLTKEEHVALTKMDAGNLAMVMAPNILRCESDDPQVLYKNARREMGFIKTLILSWNTSFAL